jgi:restriction endonuclease S subunit
MYSGFIDNVVSLAGGSAQPNVSTKNIENLTIPLPPLKFQEQVLSYLNDLQAQLTSLESLQKQSERNAKFILDSYLNTTQ